MKNITRVYGAHFLRIEALLAVLATVCFALWLERFDGFAAVQATLKGNRSAVYGALASVFGALFGFVVTAVAIVLGYAESERLAVVRASQHYTTLWKVFVAGIHALALATLIALLALIFDRDSSPSKVLLYCCAFASVLALFRVARTVWMLEKVIFLVTKQRPSQV